MRCNQGVERSGLQEIECETLAEIDNETDCGVNKKCNNFSIRVVSAIGIKHFFSYTIFDKTTAKHTQINKIK